MTTEQHAEEILLESGEDLANEPTEEAFSNVTAQLLQTQKWKHFSMGSRILDNRFLFVKKFQNGKTSTYWVNLLYVNPQPRRDRRINWGWAVTALIFLSLTGSLFVLEYYFQLSERFSYYNSVIVLLATMAVLSILAVIYTSKNNIVMNTLNGGIPIASFVYNSPSREQFKSYIKTLRTCIETVQEQNSHKTTDRLANELAEHRRLKTGKIISDQDYEQAKNRILSQH